MARSRNVAFEPKNEMDAALSVANCAFKRRQRAFGKGAGFKRLRTQMIASSLVAVQPSCAISKRRADSLAHDYYFGKPQDQKLAKDIAAELAITPERILGQAIAMSGEYRLFDRLVDSRVTMLNGLLKDHERQLRKAEKRKAAARQRDPTRVNDNSVAAKKQVA
jgi:hypothetical protein